MRRQVTILCLVGLTAVGTVAQAAMYRWVNEQGVTVYSQTPPPSGHATRIPPPPPPPQGAPTAPSLQEQLNQIDKQNAERREREAKEAKLRQRQAVIDANCEAARHNLQVLQGPARRNFAGEDGTYQHFTDEERQQRIQEAKDQIKEFCSE